MANDASVTLSATVLPDEIAKTIAGSMTVTPADTSEKWYFKKTQVQTTAADLIAGNFIDYTAVDQDTPPVAVATGDQVKFLMVKNLSSGDGIMISFDGSNNEAAHGNTKGIHVGASETICLRPNDTTVAEIHAISADIGGTGDGVVECLVAALIHDISV